MKTLFTVCTLILSALSVTWAWFTPGQRSDKPVLYWVTDPNPARVEQVNRFHAWLQKNGHPPFELRLETANSDSSKKVIQGVSGVAGDILDTNDAEMPYFHAMGILEDVTEPAKRLGFDPSRSYPAIKSQIVLDGRQYRFPCNVSADMFWVNKKTFAGYGLPLPTRRWDWQQFEELGKRFIAAANKSGQRQTVFFVDSIDFNVMRRSLGVDVFNETLTRCALDDPRYVRVLQTIHKWTFDDHLLPSAADKDSFVSDAGYGGSIPQLFNSGSLGMVRLGRYALIQFRQFGTLDLAVVEPPCNEFTNTLIGTRAAAVYAGSKHKDLAELFLAFLASEEYNMHVVVDADSLPPNPKYTQTEAYLHPPAHPNEWGSHQIFADAVNEIGVPESVSPFVLPTTVEELDTNAYDGFMRSGRLDAQQAASEASQRINDEIKRSLDENPSLVPRYQELIERQKQIDAFRTAGRKIPIGWIENPFYRAYYQSKGWTE